MERSRFIAGRINLAAYSHASRCENEACPMEACAAWKRKLAHLNSCTLGAKCSCSAVRLSLDHFNSCPKPDECDMCRDIVAGGMDPHVFAVSLLQLISQENRAQHAESLAQTCPPTPTHEEHCALCGGGTLWYASDNRVCDVCAVEISRGEFYESEGYQRVTVTVCAKCHASGPEFAHKYTRGKTLSEPFVRCKTCDRIFHISCVLVLKVRKSACFFYLPYTLLKCDASCAGV